jgi:D-alanyl-lipoteichoic acid acyltransferase DltB (MBOAT superfamily)
MLFDSPVYFAFLLVVVPIYWALRHKGQNQLMLVASYIFYGWWDYRFLGLIVLSTIVDFFCALAVESSSDRNRRKLLLAFSVTLNIAFLGYFKYYNFFADSLNTLLLSVGVEVSPTVLNVVLPPGISFYTFQAVAYMVDVYFRRLSATRSFVDYACFIALFPHLIAGPIQRPGHLLPQVTTPRSLNTSAFFDGVMLILIGLFRKVVVADTCAVVANAAFDGRLGPASLPLLLVAMYAFAWQIYGDFSGYSDIARGSAQLLGFHFMVNFKQPYLAESLQDFWRRWHISLSTWLRDYLYIPLGGSRSSEGRTSRNLMITMLLGGLWHGANWTFVIWGGIHGGWLALERQFKRRFPSAISVGGQWPTASKWVKRILVFHLVGIAWIFFRAGSVGDALSMLGGALSATANTTLTSAALLVAGFATPLFLVDLSMERSGDEYPSQSLPNRQKLAVAAAIVGVLLVFSANETSAFIYFQF